MMTPSAPLSNALKMNIRIDTAGAGNADDLDVGRVGHTAASREIRSGVAATSLQQNATIFGLNSSFFFYRHIASTSARICLFENPCRSIAPDGHVPVQAPHP